MFAYTGIVSRVVVSDWLVLVMAAPLLVLLHTAWSAFTDEEVRAPEAREASTRRACVAGQLLGLGALVWLVYTVGIGGAAVQHVLRLVRVGQLDVSIDLLLDATSAAMALAVLATGATFFATRERVSTRLAATGNLVVAGALLAVLADGAVAATLGASVAGLAYAFTSQRARPGVMPRLADIAFVAGAATLFWVQGGSWGNERYLPDLAPRVVAATDAAIAASEDDVIHVDAAGQVTRRTTPDHRTSATGHATLTFDALPGAFVYLDESKTPLGDKGGLALRAPMANVSVSSGLHTMRVHAGGGLDDYVITRVTFGDGAHVTLVPLGPTLVYRQVADQLVLTPERGTAPRDRFRGREAPLTVAFLLLGLATVLRASEGGEASVAALGTVASLAPAIILVRFAPLLTLSPYAVIAVGVLGAACAAVGATLAARATTWPTLTRQLTVAVASAALVGVALGSRAAAVATLVTGMLGIATIGATAGRRGGSIGEKPVTDGAHRTAAAIASAALAGAPVPVAAGTWAMTGCFAPAMSNVRPAVALVIVALGVVYAGASSFAVWRAHHLGCRAGEREKKKGAWGGRPLLALGALSLVLGAAMAASPRLLGADDDGPFAVLLGGTPKGGLAVAAATLVAFGAALGGWASARKRYGATRPKDWAEREARVEKHPLVRLASWAGTVPVSLGASVGSVLARMTSEVDEHVFHFVPRAIAAVAGAGGWVATAAERDITLRVGARVASFRWTPSRRVVFVLVVFAVMVVVGSFVMSARSR